MVMVKKMYKINIDKPEKIKIEYDNLILKIDVLEDVIFEINYDDIKSVYINIKENIKADICEYYKEDIEVQTFYNLKENSTLNIIKIYNSVAIKEKTAINLEEKAKIKYITKTLTKENQNYKIDIFHNGNNSESIIYNDGIALGNADLKYTINGYINENTKDINCTHNSKIINYSKGKTEIKPNLFINDYRALANHSAYIGKFSRDEIFYLKTRTLNMKEAEKLLVKAFLMAKIGAKANAIILIENIINQYWR
jgi:Fe-S cluster assembly scaffold protein SufB